MLAVFTYANGCSVLNWALNSNRKVVTQLRPKMYFNFK